MTVTTQKGDSGRTFLMFDRPVRKDALRVDAYGTIDELVSFLGLAKSLVRSKAVRALLHECQRDLFIVASELATEVRDLKRLEFRVGARRVQWIEEQIRRREKRLQLKECCFIIPGGSTASALLDVCRAVARRAERLAWALRRRQQVPNQHVLVYLNRLSDLLWLLARGEEKAPARFVARR